MAIDQLLLAVEVAEMILPVRPNTVVVVYLDVAAEVAVMKPGRYKLVETLRGVANAVLVPVINPGKYKLVETLSGVTKAVEVPVMKPGRYKLVETLSGVTKAVEVPVTKPGP